MQQEEGKGSCRESCEAKSKRISSQRRPVAFERYGDKFSPAAILLIRHTAPARSGHNTVLGNKLQRYGFP